ncbi:MAG: hypothetical protein RLZZ271_516 [Pseudomonadota bacterium]|jgi:diacylglycerol kinase (ATP)
MNQPPDNLFQRRVVRSLMNSLAGLRATWVHEEAFRVEICLCVLLVPLALYLGQDGISRALLVGSLVVVLVAELLNSAIEAAVDRISTEWHEQSKLAKDMGSAAVFVAMMLAVLTWVLVLWR